MFQNPRKFLLSMLLASIVPAIALASSEEKKEYDDCVARVKKDYPVPPGNVNAQNQMIRQECGSPPK